MSSVAVLLILSPVNLKYCQFEYLSVHKRLEPSSMITNYSTVEIQIQRCCKGKTEQEALPQPVL